MAVIPKDSLNTLVDEVAGAISAAVTCSGAVLSFRLVLMLNGQTWLLQSSLDPVTGELLSQHRCLEPSAWSGAVRSSEDASVGEGYGSDS